MLYDIQKGRQKDDTPTNDLSGKHAETRALCFPQMATVEAVKFEIVLAEKQVEPPLWLEARLGLTGLHRDLARMRCFRAA